jgi:hypothetical protein
MSIGRFLKRGVNEYDFVKFEDFLALAERTKLWI